MPDHDVTVITLQLAAAPDGPADGPASVLGRLHNHHQQIGSITRAAELLVRRGAAVSIHQQTLNAVVPDAATIDQAMQLAQTVKALAPDTPVEVTQWSAGNAVHSVQITDVPPPLLSPATVRRLLLDLDDPTGTWAREARTDDLDLLARHAAEQPQLTAALQQALKTALQQLRP